ncbi:hypothetical protein ACZ87_00930 [Candidatus Erwinia dacicola]|uniref:Uncharacterized protein n=1 Tax=Candidatus Erwinia dacicola TaxID=252393 RepID=A0A328TTW8_9GAMM|nr:hypothetical protein ACZ87_00930 [Candidatus Erwinia dacicola]
MLHEFALYKPAQEKNNPLPGKLTNAKRRQTDPSYEGQSVRRFIGL